MQEMMKSWFKYVLFVGIFGICINLIYLALPVYVMVIYDKVLYSFSRATLYSLSLGLLISLVVMGLLDYFRARILGRAGNRLVQKMAPFVIRAMANDPSGYTRGLHDLELLRSALVQGKILYLLDLPWVILYLGVLYVIHPLVGGVALSTVFLAAMFQLLLRQMGKKQYTIADVGFYANAEFLQACLGRAEIVSAMGMQAPLLEKYTQQDSRIQALRSGADAFYAGIGAMIRTLHLAGLAAIFGAGAFVFFSNQITAGVIFASVMILARLFYPLEQSLFDMKASIEAKAAYRRLKQFVDTREPTERLSLPLPQGRLEGQALSLAVAGKTVLHNISFDLNPGETLGILGPSSAGKTSLCRLVLGIWPAVAGKVRLDGAELAQWPRDELGKYLGYLPQETQLFPGTVAQNIARLGQVDSDQVVKAARKAGVHEVILKLAQGYDTQIDSTGRTLAAGQRQLISLARALYGDPKLVVLDEPHTHLDDLGFRMVLTALQHLKQEKITTLVVTDRPNLLQGMDKILVIKEGQVAMYGAGKEVLNQLAGKQQPQQAAGA